MELLNATKMQAGYAMGMQPDGRELLVVVVKGTFTIPKKGEEPQLASEQLPLVEADTFTGEPGMSAPIYECDYSPFKPRCDVILLGSAYAPGGIPTERVRVSLSVGEMRKEFDVVGNRFWISEMFGATEPELFTSMPISYDVAFGGLDNLSPDPSRHEAHPANPIGRGFFPKSKGGQIAGMPLPNTEEPGKPIKSPKVSYDPMGFGPIGRAWQPRPQYAGTYDQNWIDNNFPFLPLDFDDRYFQSAPVDQQIDYPTGNEEVTLLNLTAEGEVSFRIPTIVVPVAFFYRNYQEKALAAAADTVVLEPDLGRFSILWRVCLPLRKNIFEVAQTIVGRMSSGWYRARRLGKMYYPSLGAMTELRRNKGKTAAGKHCVRKELGRAEFFDPTSESLLSSRRAR